MLTLYEDKMQLNRNKRDTVCEETLSGIFTEATIGNSVKALLRKIDKTGSITARTKDSWIDLSQHFISRTIVLTAQRYFYSVGQKPGPPL